MKKLTLFAIVVIFMFVASCGGGSGDGAAVDTTPPTVISTSPADGATGVDVSASITATFSEAVDGSAITTNAFTLSITPPVSGTVIYDSATNTVTFAPDANLDYITTYTATITAGVADLAGNSMASDYTWSFTTGSVVQLPETGQTTCSDASGNVIECDTQGQTQDAAVLAGVSWPSPRFTDNNDGTVTDELTGLIWLKDATCFGQRTWTQALSDANNLVSGSCGLTDGSVAGDWRLPNINELESLVNAEESNVGTWLNGQGFTNVQSGSYWSATTYADLTARAWSLNMRSGGVGADDKTISYYYAWPVRAGQTDGNPDSNYPANIWKTGQTICYDAAGDVRPCAGTGEDGDIQAGVSWPSPRFTDNRDGTVTDRLTGLMWTRDAYAPGPAGCTTGVTMSWQDGLDYVACLNTNSYLGHNDWRLPNRKELHSLTDFSQSIPALPSGYLTYFTNVPLNSFYWSSSTVAGNTGNAWCFDMWDGNVSGSLFKSLNSYVWPVRAGNP